MYQGTTVPLLTGTLTGVVAGDGITATYSTAGTNTSAVNTYPITATLHDPSTKLANYSVTSTPGTLTINSRPASIVYVGAFSGSYASCSSNIVSARLTDTITGAGIPGASVIITVGTQSVTLATDATGLASTSLGLTQNPGTVSANASFIGDATHSGSATSNVNNYTINPSSGVGPLTGNPIYTGFTFFWTTSASSSSATLTLSATVQDTSTPCHGDIRSAKVTFAVRHSDGTYTPLSGAQNLPVGLVNPADSTVGTASATTQYNLGNSNADSIQLAVIVGGNYTRNQSADDTIVEVAKPGLANSMIGVGKLDNTASPLSSGYLATAPVPGSNYYTSVASNLQYNKSLTNPQGKVNILVKSYNKADGTIDTNIHTYSIVSNSISGLTEALDPRTNMTMVSFSAKANITEVTNPLSPVSVDSGVTIQLIFSPSGTNTPQTGSITVPKKTGGLWFTSAWDGTRTVQKTLAGGIVAVQ